ncbi:MAG: metal ABC transporter permease [Acidimicrobiia bacterium]|nr:metal ABC transporter permease [Acidimicrobiia bacterium]
MSVIAEVPFFWPFDTGSMQLALAAAVVIAACAPLIGVFIVQRRQSLMGDGVGHVAFAGVAAGFLLDVWPVWTALVFAIGAAVVIEILRSRGRATGDLALALVFYGGLAAGSIMVGKAGVSGERVENYLFGSILELDTNDLLTIIGLGIAILVVLGVIGRALFAITLDEEASRVSGLPVAACNGALSVLTAVTIVAAMRVLGILLVAAMMVLPVASSRLLARSFRNTVLFAVGIGVVAAIAGLAAARAWDLEAGGSIVLCASILYGVVALVRGDQQTARTDG